MDAQNRVLYQSPVSSRPATPIPNTRHRQNLAYLETLDEKELVIRRRPSVPQRSLTSEVETILRDVPPLFSGSPAASPHEKTGNSLSSSITYGKDIETQYPKDDPGQEMSEFARVWRVYLDEATKADFSMTEGCNRSIDVLLVFTGLFSAVLTTFIIQSFQMFVPDKGDMTNAFLAQLVTLQAASTGSAVPRPPPGPPASETQMRWVNGLWFAALSCSLSTALISMLAKQWLQAYIAHVSGSPRHCARQRQARCMNLHAWHVQGVINSMPLLLHAALLLFFAGLIVLLWSVDIPLTFATWIIAALSYAFYFASIWLPLVFPGSPYRHPISDHIRKWLSAKRHLAGNASSTELPDLEIFNTNKDAVVKPEDKLDALVLIWLFTRSTDKQVVSTALQAMAGLPRDFTALKILRDEGALRLVEQEFQNCFEQDTTLGLKWHIIDPYNAASYCKAWMNLTRGTKIQWPFESYEPLLKLQDHTSHPDAAAIAACAVAVSSFESYLTHWELLVYLGKYSSGEIQLNHTTLCWLLDSIIDGMTRWEMPFALIHRIVTRGVAVLLRLLPLTEDVAMQDVRSAVALALYVFTYGPRDLHLFMPEEGRRAHHPQLMLLSLSHIAKEPVKFGLKDKLLDIAAQELCKHASPLVAQAHRFSPETKDAASASVLNLFLAGRIRPGLVPDKDLADTLHLLNQTHGGGSGGALKLAAEQHPVLAHALVETLGATAHADIASWSVRLLRPLLSTAHLPTLHAFVVKNGIDALVRAAKAGDIENRRLQVDSWRTLYAFVTSSTAAYMQHTGRRGSDTKRRGTQSQVTPSPSQPPAQPLPPIPSSPPAPGPPSRPSSLLPPSTAPSLHAEQAQEQFDAIFVSPFLDHLCYVIASKRWWLLDAHWVSALAKLCRLRARYGGWHNVVNAVQSAIEMDGKGETVVSDTLYQLDAALNHVLSRGSTSNVGDGPGLEVHDQGLESTIPAKSKRVRRASKAIMATMENQRSIVDREALQPTTEPPDKSSSTWFQ